MGVRENKVERHLDSQVTELGGITRKWVSPGVDGVPDRIVFYKSAVFVEVKTVDGDLSEEQVREHKRLRKQGAQVTTVYGNIGVDRFMNDLHLVTTGWNFEHEYR